MEVELEEDPTLFFRHGESSVADRIRKRVERDSGNSQIDTISEVLLISIAQSNKNFEAFKDRCAGDW